MKKENVLFILILLIQLIVYIFLGTQKAYIHMDEAYSIGLTNYDKVEITNNEDFYNNWHNNNYYEDYISISTEEVKDISPVYENQKNDVHPPFYYLLLRIAYTFNLDSFSKWPGIILNIIIVILSNILIYKILLITTKNGKLSLIICLVVGLIISTYESVTYIRMYALNSLILLFISYLHLINYDKEKLEIKQLILIGIVTLIASLTHYYNVIYIGVLYLIFIIKYIKNKQYKNIIKYTITMIISAILSLIIFPYSINHIFMGYRGQGVLESFTNISKMMNNLGNYIAIVNNDIFNGLLWAIAIFLIGTLAYKSIKNKKVTLRLENKKMLAIIIPAIIYFIIVAVSSPYTEIRYIIPISSFILIYVMYLIYIALSKLINDNKKINTICLIISIIMIVFPIIINAKIDNLYLQQKEIVKDIEEKYSNIPTIYLFNTNQNRFLDDIYLFTKLNESYIYDINSENKQNIEEILKDKDIQNGLIVFANENFDKEYYLEELKQYNAFEKCEHLKRMNACDIYYIY